ncbi:MAG: histidine phosphotransferase family protein [Rhodovarius sp.]|nr:histidine phosphotransferase family protein [Rhodovarius sp.]MDW8315688.1 histidine phosphotransferase family protein [Rhodovarius sp.]
MPDGLAAMETLLTQRLAARILHDLAGPLATIAAAAGSPGAEDNGLRDDALLAETLSLLRLRHRLYAAAFGPGAAISWQEMAELLPSAPGAHRLRFRLALPADLPAPREGMGGLLLSALLLAAEALPRGGMITLTLAAGAADRAFLILPEGQGARWPHGFLDLLAGRDQPPEAATPRGVLAPWLVALAAAQRCRLALAMGPSGQAAPLLIQPARE